MFKTIATTRFVVCLLILAGCSTALKDTSDLANLAVVNDQIMSGQVAAVIKSVPLSATENLIVDHAINQYAGFVDKWKSSITYLDTTEPIFAAFIADYGKIIVQYRGIKEKVVAGHRDEYTEENLALLNEYHDRVERFIGSVNGLVAAGNRREALLNAVRLVQVLIGITGGTL